MWIEPIYDRKQSDITRRTSKGYLAIEDLNRIENNIAHIANMFGMSGWFQQKTWTHADLPTQKEMQRIISGVSLLCFVWEVPNLPTRPKEPINTWQKVNDIEKILDIIYWNKSISDDLALRTGAEGYSDDALL